MNKPAPKAKPYKNRKDAISRCAKSIYRETHGSEKELKLIRKCIDT